LLPGHGLDGGSRGENLRENLRSGCAQAACFNEVMKNNKKEKMNE